MDLTLDEEQRLLVDSARAFLARACPLAHVRAMEADARGFSPELWQQMAALGWPGLAVAEPDGGSGRSFLEVTLLLEEMGRVLLPSPYLPTVVLAAPLLAALAEPRQRTRWLPALAAGRLTAALALAEPGWRDEWQEVGLAARRDGAALVVSGRKTFVPFAPYVDLLLMAVRVDGQTTLVVLPPDTPGVATRRLATLGGEPLYEVTCADVRVAATDVLGAPGAAARVLPRVLLHAATGTLAYMVGAAERVLAMTVEHARTRVQFGRPIGSFQAVAHRCADMRAELDGLRYLVYQAAWSLAAGRAGELEVGAAKAYGNEALRQILMHAHQVHGAVGFATEHDLPLFTRRAKAAELAWGGGRLHREHVARAMGL